jgi:hypothetical protein
MNVRIKRAALERYTVTIVDQIMADGTPVADEAMGLDGDVLRSMTAPGRIRVGGALVLKLGPVSLARVKALTVGMTVELTGGRPA